MLLRQQKPLIRHLDRFKDLGSKLFETSVSFYDLEEVLLSILKDDTLDRVYFAIDALDECNQTEPGLSRLLKLISKISDENDKVKWLVTSRNVSYIEEILGECKAATRLSLELTSDSVTSAINVYIDHKMQELHERHQKIYMKERNNALLEDVGNIELQVTEELRRNSGGTFLWVALVFRQIDEMKCGADNLLDVVRKIPSGVTGMYDAMMERIIRQDGDYS